MDFYIFWKFGFCRTPPSTRQLFYRLVNLPSPHPTLSIHLSSLHSPFPHPTFIQISPIINLTLPISHILFPTHYLSTTYPQVINSLSTAFPQVIHNPLLYSSTSHPPQYPHFYCYFSNHPHYNSYSIPIQSYPQVH